VHLEAILQTLRETFPAETIEAQALPIDETFIALPPDCVHLAVQVLIERNDLGHLSTITGQDTGSEIELLYHFWDGRGLTLKTSLPREGVHITTITDLISGASYYEREVSEMLGVTFDGHPDPRPLLLPDDWDGEAPLRHQPLPPSPPELGGTEGGRRGAGGEGR